MRVLVSARHKLARAQIHLEELERAISAYLTPLDLVVTIASEDEVEYRMADLPPVPNSLTLLFGDFLQNARASLDHAVYQLSTEAQPDFLRTGFPVVVEEGRFDDEADRLMPHLPPRARAVVRNFQPFAWGLGQSDLLLSLHRLARIDRHRTVTLFATVVETSGVGWHRTSPMDDAPNITFYRPAVSPGDVVLRLPSAAREPTASFSPRFTGSVIVGEPDRFADMPSVALHASALADRVDAVLAYLEQVA